MSFEKTPIEGLKIFTPRVFEDDRGYFFESFNKRTFQEAGITCDFVQDNQSFSTRGTVRGIHLQTGQSAQAKLVRVLSGEVYDVAVDLRPNSPTFGKHYGVTLSAENKKQFFIPRGFGHGFSVISETAIFTYKCDNFYDKSAEAGIIFNDEDLSIDWRVAQKAILISDKDAELPTFADYKRQTIR